MSSRPMTAVREVLEFLFAKVEEGAEVVVSAAEMTVNEIRGEADGLRGEIPAEKQAMRTVLERADALKPTSPELNGPVSGTVEKSADGSPRPDSLAEAEKTYDVAKRMLQNGALKTVPRVAPVGMATQHAAVLLARAALPDNPTLGSKAERACGTRSCVASQPARAAASAGSLFWASR